MRRLAVATGLLLSLVGLTLALVPSLARTLSTSGAFVVLVGVVAIGYGVRALLSSRRHTDGPAVPPRVEGREGVSVPGRAFDRSLAAGSASVRERLHAAAVEVLADGPEDRSVADSTLERGDWTDDGHAAAFFSSAVAPPSDTYGAPDPRRQARHVVRALGRRVGVDWDESDGSDATGPTAGHGLEERDDVEAAEPSYVPRPGEVVERTTDRWTGVVGVALVTGGSGVAVAQPSLVLAGGLATAIAGVVAIGRAGAAPSPSLSVSRSVAVDDPHPGDEVTVTTTVRNDGGSRLHDVRIVDGVPAALLVTDGAARRRCALDPGESTTFTYELRVERGSHEFRPAHVVVGDRLGAHETVVRAGDREPAVDCQRPCPPLPPETRDQVSALAGLLPSNVGGEGVEFHSVREYRRGDPMSSIDWNRLARTGELATRRFNEERRASVVVLVDARPSAYAAPDDTDRVAVDRCVTAADAAIGGLLDAGHSVGLAALSTTGTDCWLAPRTGRDHRAATRRTLASSPAIPPAKPDGVFSPTRSEATLLKRLPGSAQVVLCTPLVDDYPAELARTLEAHGHRTTLVAPDPTSDETTGGRLATVERLARASDLRATGVPVYDWSQDESLALSLARQEGISR